MLGPDLADELLHLELGARVEPGRRLVEEQEHGRREERARERDLLLHPARELLHRLAAPLDGEPDAGEDRGDPLARDRRRHAVEPRRVGEVLLGAHPLEEARLDRDAVDETPHGTLARERVVAEDAGGAAVVQQQRREQADERRLAGAVPAEHRDALAAGDRERQALERWDAAPAREAAVRLGPAPELLAQVTCFDCWGVAGCCESHVSSLERGRRSWRARAPRRGTALQVP